MKIYAKTYDDNKKVLSTDKWSSEDYTNQRKAADSSRFQSIEKYLTVGEASFKQKLEIGTCIDDYLEKKGITENVFCVGVGDAYSEYGLKKSRKVMLTDFDTRTISKLQNLFKTETNLSCLPFDLKKDSFGEYPNKYPILLSVGLLYIFDDAELTEIFKKIKGAGFKEFLVVSFTHIHASNNVKRILKLAKRYMQLYFSRFKKGAKLYGYFRETGAYQRILKKSGLSISESRELEGGGSEILYRVKLR